MNSKKKVIYFDLETKYLTSQARDYECQPCKTCGEIPTKSTGGVVVEGGEDNLFSIPMSVAAVKDTTHPQIFVYLEAGAKELVEHLHTADLIVGYNIKRFDYIILQKYGGTLLSKMPTFDIFEEIQKATDQMISLKNITKRTLNIEMEKLGGETVNEWWYGEHQKIIDYCKHDVLITQRLFNHACKTGYLSYWNWDERQESRINTWGWATKARQLFDSMKEKPKFPLRKN